MSEENKPAFDMDALMAKVAETVNSAITAREKRFTAQLDEKLKAATPAPAPAPVPQADPAIEAKVKGDPALAALQARLDEMSKKYEAADKARAEAETKRRDDQAYTTLRGALKTVKPELQEVAAKMLFHVEKRVTFDEDGNPLFRMKRDDGDFVELPLESGVEHWSKSKEAEAFLPAPGGNVGQGRGGRAPHAGSIPSGRTANGIPVYDKPATSDAEKVGRAAEREAALAKLGIDL